MAHSAQKPLWESTGDERAAGVRGMFATIAPSYDRLNGMMSLGRHNAWRDAAIRASGLKGGDALLDVCAGTGDFLIAAQKATSGQARLAGLDFCEPMLAIAREKLETANLSLGDACRLPFASEAFDVVTVGWGLRNVPDLNAALLEIQRVLKPGGRLVTLDCFTPESALARVLSAPATALLPWLGKLTKDAEAYKYLPKSTLLFARRTELETEFERAGFKSVTSRPYLLGNVCMHVGVKPWQ